MVKFEGELFSIENELFLEIVKKGVRGNEPNGRTVQPIELILISIETKSYALQSYGEFFRVLLLFSSYKILFESVYFCLRNKCQRT